MHCWWESKLVQLQWFFKKAQMVKHLPAVQETWVRSLGWEDPLEKEMAPHSSTLAWKILWTEEPGRLQSMELQRVGHDWETSISLSPYNPAILLMIVHPKKAIQKVYVHQHYLQYIYNRQDVVATYVFIDRWLAKDVIHTHTHTYIYNGVLFDHKNEILPFLNNIMDLEGFMLSEISQRKINTICFHLYVESKI